MYSPHLIAESVSPAHTDLGRCLRLVQAAQRVGFREVKFHQVRRADLFARSAHRLRPELCGKRVVELPEAAHSELSTQASECGLFYCVTPHYLRAVAACEPWVDHFSISSYQLLWSDLLREVAATGKPVRLAVGMAELDEILRAVDLLRDHGAGKIELLHSVNVYPTPISAANLKAIATLRQRLGLEVGWADHTAKPEIVSRALRIWGAHCAELVFDFDGSAQAVRDGYAWTPPEIAGLLRGLRDAVLIARGAEGDGDGVKTAHPLERAERDWRCDPLDGLRPLRGLRRDAPLDTSAGAPLQMHG